ncbi:MAG: YkgJ family cysteine cluster protein [Candidatus Bathyarchaeota archaeon]
MDYILAIITQDQKGEKNKVDIIQEEFKFRCKKCADLCCKLGGPELTKNDLEKIKNAGHNSKDFFDPKKHINNNLRKTIGSLKTKQDGSCIFLQCNIEIKLIKCRIYDFRPTLCRIYPFRIENFGSNRIVFKYIPCCKGLNNPKGKNLDRNFILEKVEEARKIFRIKR